MKRCTEREKEKPSRFIVRKRQRDSVVRADKTDPIVLLAPSNVMSGQGVIPRIKVNLLGSQDMLSSFVCCARGTREY